MPAYCLRLRPESAGGAPAEVKQLIAMINEQLWIGHFDMWNHEGVVLFRNSHLLTGGADVSPQQCEALLRSATDAATSTTRRSSSSSGPARSAAEALEPGDVRDCWRGMSDPYGRALEPPNDVHFD